MKIFVDNTKWVIEREERESPFYMGDNFASVVRVLFKEELVGFPTLSFLKSNGRKRGPINYDASGYGVEIVDGVYWHYFNFTLSNSLFDIKLPKGNWLSFSSATTLKYNKNRIFSCTN